MVRNKDPAPSRRALPHRRDFLLYVPAEFPQDEALCYLNHAAVAPWPKRTAEAVQAFAFENLRQGAAEYPKWMEVQQQLRERMAWLINAPQAQDIALVKNTSEGLSFVAAGIDWQAGDEIVGISDDFPSNRLPWEALADQAVKFVAVDTQSADDPTSALLEACNTRTRLLAVSSAHFATGVILDLARLSSFARANNILLCIDAIQTLGAVPFDIQATPADFVVADGHKWMLGPEGIGLFYVNPAIRGALKLTQFGWAMREEAGNYNAGPWQPANSARRFEAGSPNMLGIHGLNASLSLLQEVGMSTVHDNLQRIVHVLREALEDLPGCTIRTPANNAGIVAFRFEQRPSDSLYQGLMQQQVICASRGGYVRFSPHFYTRESRIEAAVEQIRHLI